jgi:anthranilate phosphoribosyltransferase
MKTYLKKIMEGKSLSEDEAEKVIGLISENELPLAQVGALLGALRTKGETSDEISGFARYLRKKAVPFPFEGKNILDTCGTGGDDIGSFNISTAVAFVLASAGVKVAKHGNRSVSSQCGCADVLEELNVPLDLKASDSARELEKNNFTFLFAPAYHPSFKSLAVIRRSIQVRTIFNLMGPLLNPAKVNRQLVGVFHRSYVLKMAQALKSLGLDEAMVVHGEDGMDEFSLSGPSYMAHLKEGKIEERVICPEDVGLKRAGLDKIKGGDKRENADLLEKILKGHEEGPKRDIVALNAGGAFLISNIVSDFKSGVELASSLMREGKAYGALENIRG